MPVGFGYGLITCQRYPSDARTDAELYAEALELSREAEELGFDSVWVSEHHFVDDGYLPSPMPLCAAIAAVTERITVGTALALAPLYHPLRLAEDVAVVDLISGGRTVLGVGIGWREEEFEAFGVPLDERGARLEDAVAILRQAWSEGLTSGTERSPYPDVPVTPKPARPDGPSIWIGALAGAAIRRAGRIGDGFMATEVTPEAFGEQVAAARGERERSGLDPETLVASLHLPTFVWDGDEAWDLVKEHHHYVAWKYEDMEGARHRAFGPAPKPLLTEEVEAELRDQIVLGTPKEVAEKIAAYRDAAGGEIHYIARLYWPGMDAQVQRRSMTLFAEEVIPLLRDGGEG
jgi:alkanesulfonate monooxygenase SsuD/methylene tetrahydromethanopterin reductase-like flavin-dependent oxidoreductase (luciferase family)